MTKKTPKPLNQLRRPTKYTPELGDLICELVSEGSNLSKICKRDDMPKRTTVYDWFKREPEFFDAYARARETRADSRAEEMDDIRDQVKRGELDPSAARVIIDTLKWQCGKERPKLYGDRLTLAGDAKAPIVTETIDQSKTREMADKLDADLNG